MSELAHLSDRDLNTLAALDLTAARTGETRDAVRALGAGARDWKRLSWGGTGQQAYDSFSFGSACQGWLIINDGATDAYLSLSDVTSTAVQALITVPAGSWMAVPLVSSRIVLGGAGAGTALVFGLDHAPAPAAGAFELGYHSYAKGKTHNAVSIGAGSTKSVDLATAGFSKLVLLARLTGSADSDLSLVVVPYEDDGTTVGTGGTGSILTTERAQASKLSTSVVYCTQQYDLHGIDKVRVTVGNANASAQTATCVYYLQK